MNVWRKIYLPADGIGTLAGEEWSLSGRFPTPARGWPGPRRPYSGTETGGAAGVACVTVRVTGVPGGTGVGGTGCAARGESGTSAPTRAARTVSSPLRLPVRIITDLLICAARSLPADDE